MPDDVVVPFQQTGLGFDPILARSQKFRECYTPFQIGPDGGIRYTDDPAVAKGQHLRTIICTRLGERIMRPNYGTRLYDRLFEPADDYTTQDIESEVRKAVSTEEPDVELVAVEVTVGEEEPTALTVVVSYKVPPFPGIYSIAAPITPTFSEES